MKKKALMPFLIIIRNGSSQERDDQKVFVQDCHTVQLKGNKAFTPAVLCLLWRVPTSVTAVISWQVNQIQSFVCLNGVSFKRDYPVKQEVVPSIPA